MSNLAPLIDHTLLKPEANANQIDSLCQEAIQYGFASVCVNPVWVPRAAAALKDAEPLVCTVVGFPLGATSPQVKAAETTWAIENGAQEIDMVINIAAALAGEKDTLVEDISAVVAAADGHTVKVIIEACLLTDDAKVLACQAAKEAGADFVKTSTGFSTGGATVDDVALMRRTVGDALGVKASGGIRDRETAEAMVAAGANRLGASAGVAICSEAAE